MNPIICLAFDPGSKKTAYAAVRLEFGKTAEYLAHAYEDNWQDGFELDFSEYDPVTHRVFVERPFEMRPGAMDMLAAVEFGGYVVGKAREAGLEVVRLSKREWATKLCHPDKLPRKMDSSEGKALVRKHLEEKVAGIPERTNEHVRDAIAMAYVGCMGARG